MLLKQLEYFHETLITMDEDQSCIYS